METPNIYQILNNEIKHPIYDWAKERGIQVTWDFDREYKWLELYDDDGNMVLQVDYRMPFDFFIDFLTKVKEDINRQDLSQDYFYGCKDINHLDSFLQKIKI